MQVFTREECKVSSYKVCANNALCRVGLAVLLLGRRAEAWEQTAWSKDSQDHTGRNNSLSWSTFGRDGTASKRTKEKVGNIEQPH